jgi:(p)ppGpp synthase/HD superfamily hydrolase
MHQIAEFGVAAHFDYKIGRKSIAALLPASDSDDVLSSSSATTEVSVISDERVESNEAGESGYISALENARQTLVQSNVFVFLPGSSSALEEGQLLSLPAGAQVVHILAEVRRKYNVETDANYLQVWRNGKLALLDEVVRNGDVLSLQKLAKTRERTGESNYFVS